MEEKNPNNVEKPKYKLDAFGILSIIVMVVSTLIGLYFLIFNK